MYTKNNRLFKIIMSESAHPYNPEAKMRETHSEGRRPTEVPLGTGNPQPMGTDVVLQLLHQKKKKKKEPKDRCRSTWPGCQPSSPR